MASGVERNCNIILTGLPRSGTTLTCYLLNRLPDTVALNEPVPRFKLPKLHDHEAVCNEIDRFFEQTRSSLLEDGTAISRHVGGSVPDNTATNRYSGPVHLLPNWLVNHFFFRSIARSWLRKGRTAMGSITVEKTLSSEFLLCIKHTSPFTALLESLYSRYPCFAVVRNPLSVLASWNSVDFPPWQGHIPPAEILEPALAQRLAQTSDRIERQLTILAWFFKRYHDILPSENILRYEEIVASGGAALKVITPCALELNEALENRNRNKLYNRNLMRTLSAKLLKMDGALWEFYTKESIELVLAD